MVTVYLTGCLDDTIDYDVGGAAITAQHLLVKYNMAERVLIHGIDDNFDPMNNFIPLIIFTEEPAFVISHFLHKFLPFWRWVVDD